MKKYRLVLASASPRRTGLLDMLGVSFEVRPASVDESLPENILPETAVEMLARKKAAATPADADEIIIAADTMVSADGILLGKPADKADAVRMLGMLSGRVHDVFTGIALACGKEIYSKAVRTSVEFRKLSDEEIENYIENVNVLDKAGAYGIQGRAAVFVRKIDGDYYNVVGLPLCTLSEMMSERFGMPLCSFAEGR